MSIFDDLSNNSYLSKKATGKQAGKKAAGKQNGFDEEFASDFMDRTGTGSGLDSTRKETGETAGKFGMKSEKDKSTADVSGETGKAKSFDEEFASESAMSDSILSSGVVRGFDYATRMPVSNAGSDAEAASDMSTDANQYGTQSYSHAGVVFSKLSDDQAKINYSGLLKQSGASEVVAVYGFGSNQNWEGVSTVTLTKDATGDYIATLPVQSGKNVNIAFKDSAQNWDNNSGLNYTFVN